MTRAIRPSLHKGYAVTYDDKNLISGMRYDGASPTDTSYTYDRTNRLVTAGYSKNGATNRVNATYSYNTKGQQSMVTYHDDVNTGGSCVTYDSLGRIDEKVDRTFGNAPGFVESIYKIGRASCKERV